MKEKLLVFLFVSSLLLQPYYIHAGDISVAREDLQELSSVMSQLKNVNQQQQELIENLQTQNERLKTLSENRQKILEQQKLLIEQQQGLYKKEKTSWVVTMIFLGVSSVALGFTIGVLYEH